MTLLKYYVIDNVKKNSRASDIKSYGAKVLCIESCYYVDTCIKLSEKQTKTLQWIIQKPFGGNALTEVSQLDPVSANTLLVEIGPRLSFCTPFSTNAVSICHYAGLTMIKRIERASRYLLQTDTTLKIEKERALVESLHDPMTQMRYIKPLSTFEIDNKRLSWTEIDILKNGESALLKANAELGLAMDDHDIKLYTELFKNILKKNPTSIECFDLAQSNSEHSRHWYFNGIMTIDGVRKAKTMFQLVKETRDHSNDNNVIAFRDNSSAIRGYEVNSILPTKPGGPCSMHIKRTNRHITLTAETHNFPTGVAPFPGATTGTGGRQRDQHAAGRGSHVVAGTAGYCVGNLNLPHHRLPWEDQGNWKLPSNLATAAKIAIEASDGASDYGNKFGEPLIAGFFRSFGLRLSDKERREWLKPIMFSGGIGSIEDNHVEKIDLEGQVCVNDLVVGKIGGPAYCIGVGGGSASSLVQGDNTQDRDFNAVQRGDAQMQQKLNRVIRSCIEMDDKNPILSIHDQGAGGNGNVLKEIVEPAGAIINTDAFTKGDSALTTLELWVAEYQESDAILLHQDQVENVKMICRRERSSLDIVGRLTGDGKIVLSEQELSNGKSPQKKRKTDPVNLSSVRHPVDLQLEHVLGKMKPKKYELETKVNNLEKFHIPEVSIREMLLQVLKLPSVGSKRFLTNKVDRCVTGLIAQQQCVGPLHTPLADVAVTAVSYFSSRGSATAIGEQPIKMLVDPRAGARLAVGEALTNLVFAVVSDIKDVKCSGNWMWPAKLPGEGAVIYSACEAMCEVMKELGIAVDGGKDSLSMAARVDNETVKCPGSLVISVYAPCPDVSVKVTPDLKCPNEGAALVHVPMSRSQPHLGGSALAHCYQQVGKQIPDLDDATLFVNAWKQTQSLIRDGKILSGHDISDGGLITCLLEMAFAGNCGIKVDLHHEENRVSVLFSERLGIVLETEHPDSVIQEYKKVGVEAFKIGESAHNREVYISTNGSDILCHEAVGLLRDVWESTSFALESLQCKRECVDAERNWLLNCTSNPPYFINFDSTARPVPRNLSSDVKVAILREEGSNGDREMCAAFTKAGFEAWDVTMQDLLSGAITLDRFRGLAFVGGFSYADVFGSAKGWAACCVFNDRVQKQLDSFYNRDDTLSFGVCNGCQLMALLGWVGDPEANGMNSRNNPELKCYLDHNESGRFECRFVTVKVLESNSIMLQNMAGSQLGVWIAHGEGRFSYRNKTVLERLNDRKMTPMRFVDNDGRPTVQYPLNPNGSECGVAALCSADGRHLAMMPHPERCLEMWNLPWVPQDWNESSKESPWNKIFRNAYEWCTADH